MAWRLGYPDSQVDFHTGSEMPKGCQTILTTGMDDETANALWPAGQTSGGRLSSRDHRETSHLDEDD